MLTFDGQFPQEYSEKLVMTYFARVKFTYDLISRSLCREYMKSHCWGKYCPSHFVKLDRWSKSIKKPGRVCLNCVPVLPFVGISLSCCHSYWGEMESCTQNICRLTSSFFLNANKVFNFFFWVASWCFLFFFFSKTVFTTCVYSL